MRKIPPASAAPVDPAVTAASASPALTASMVLTRDALSLRRMASVGLSWLVMTSGASMMRTRASSCGRLARSLRTSSCAPQKMTWMSGISRMASSAPSSTQSGALSPP